MAKKDFVQLWWRKWVMKYHEYENIEIPDELSLAVIKGIEKGKQWKRKRKRIYITAFSGVAAAFLLFFTYCFANPAFAAELPIIGKIFTLTETIGAFPGDYSTKAQVLNETIEIETSADTEEKVYAADEQQQQLIALYGDTDQEITIVPEEVYCDGASLYLGLRLMLPENQTFGLNLDHVNRDIYNLNYCQIQVTGTLTYGTFEQHFDEWLTGNQENANTFIGRIKISTEAISQDVKEMKVTITNIYWMDLERRTELERQENVSFRDYYVIKAGEWNLTIPVAVDASQTQKYEINETNELGFGIKSITVTPYEIQIASIVPELNKELLEKIYTGYEQQCLDALGEEETGKMLENALFDSEDIFWYGGFAIFDQNGERLRYACTIDEIEFHEVEMKDVETLYVYLMPEGVIAYKCTEQKIAEACNIYSYVLDVK